MRFLDRLFGPGTRETAASVSERTRRRTGQDREDLALDRYRYLLRTAPPETIEQVHREAFARLTDDQRALIYDELSRGAQTGERPLSSEAVTLARSAARAETRRPGTMERVLGPGGAGGIRTAGTAPMLGGSLLSVVAGYAIGSALASAFLPFDGGVSPAPGSGFAADAGGATGAADFGAEGFGF